MVMQTLLGSYNRANPAGRNLGSKLAAEIGDNHLAHSFNAFNTCYKVSIITALAFIGIAVSCLSFVVCV